MKNLIIVFCNDEWKELSSWNALCEKISKPKDYNINIINKENKKM